MFSTVSNEFQSQCLVTQYDVLAFVRDTIRAICARKLPVCCIRVSATRGRRQRPRRACVRICLWRGTDSPRSSKLCWCRLTGTGCFVTARHPPFVETVRDVVELYTCKPLVVVKTIVASATDKVQRFADAFRFSK
jgi:hypothetical protein